MRCQEMRIDWPVFKPLCVTDTVGGELKAFEGPHVFLILITCAGHGGHPSFLCQRRARKGCSESMGRVWGVLRAQHQ